MQALLFFELLHKQPQQLIELALHGDHLLTHVQGYFGPLEIHSQLLDEKAGHANTRSEEHTSELQSRSDLVCRLLLEKKKQYTYATCCDGGAAQANSAALHRGERIEVNGIIVYGAACAVERFFGGRSVDATRLHFDSK